MGNVLNVNLNIDSLFTCVRGSTADLVTFKYQLKDNFQALNVAAAELKELQNDVKRRVGNEEGPVTKRSEQVQGWLLRVDLKMAEVDELTRDGPEEMGKLCLGGCCCSRNCVASYRFGRRVAKRLKDVNDLKGQGTFDKVVEKAELRPLYVSQLENDLHSLEVEKEHLRGLKDDVTRRLQVEEGPATRRLEQVQVWLSRVGSVVVEVNGLIEDGPGEIEKLQRGDFSGYMLAEKVATKLKEVIDLTGQGAFEKIVDRAFAEPAYISDLESTLEALVVEKDNLWGLKVDLTRRITSEEGPQVKRLEQVGVWLSRVDTVLNLVSVLLDNGPSEIEKMRLGDFSNFMLGGKVTNTLKEVIDLKGQGVNFEKVVGKAPAEPAYVTKLEDDLEQLQAAADQLIELKDDIMKRINSEGPQMKPLEQVQAWLSNVNSLVVDIGFLRKDGLQEIVKLHRGEFSSYMLEEKVAKRMKELIHLKLQGNYKDVVARAPPEPAYLIQLETDIKSLQAACCELQGLRETVMQRLKIVEGRQVKLLEGTQLQVSQVEAILVEVNGLIRDCVDELKKLHVGDSSGYMQGEKVARTLKEVSDLRRQGVTEELATTPISTEYINHIESDPEALQEATKESMIIDVDELVTDDLAEIARLNLGDHLDARLKESRVEELVAAEHENKLVEKSPMVLVAEKPQDLTIELDAAWDETDEKKTAEDRLDDNSKFPYQEVDNGLQNDWSMAEATTVFISVISKEATQERTAPDMLLKSKTDSDRENGEVIVALENYLNSSPDRNDAYEGIYRRLDPLRVVIDNSANQNATLIKVDSNGGHGVLLDAAKALSDLNLNIVKADLQYDSQGAILYFHVMDEDGNKIHDEEVIGHINNALLSAGFSCLPSEAMPCVNHTVLEITGSDRLGLLSEFCAVLDGHDCNIVSMEVWTDRGQIALVMQIKDAETGLAVVEPERLAAIEGQLLAVLKCGQDTKEPKVAFSDGVTEAARRLHQMMLASIDDEDDLPVLVNENQWPHISIAIVSQREYARLTIKTKDWPKLLYDIVCVLTEMKYTVFHAKAVVIKLEAHQDYLIRHANGSTLSSEAEKQRLIRCLKAAIDRRATEVQALKLGFCTPDSIWLLSYLTRTFRENDITVTKAEFQIKDGKALGTFYVRDRSGQPVDSRTIDAVREQVGTRDLVVKCSTRKELELQLLAQDKEEIPARSLFGELIKSIGTFNLNLGTRFSN